MLHLDSLKSSWKLSTRYIVNNMKTGSSIYRYLDVDRKILKLLQAWLLPLCTPCIFPSMLLSSFTGVQVQSEMQSWLKILHFNYFKFHEHGKASIATTILIYFLSGSRWYWNAIKTASGDIDWADIVIDLEPGMVTVITKFWDILNEGNQMNLDMNFKAVIK